MIAIRSFGEPRWARSKAPNRRGASSCWPRCSTIPSASCAWKLRARWPARHALGLLLVRQKRMPEALTELEAAARLAPESARYGYVYAVALNGTGRPKQAIEALVRVLSRHPYDRDTLAALIAYSREQGNPGQALAYARRLAELEPANTEVRQLVQRLESEARR